jgi:hypothetical protein
MSGRDLAAYEAAMANSQTGRSINDKDLALHREMLNLGRGMSDSRYTRSCKRGYCVSDGFTLIDPVFPLLIA